MDKKLLEELGAEPMDVPWHIRLLMKYWPGMAMRVLAKKFNLGTPVFDKLHEVFAATERIDFFPSESGSRGFLIVLDGKTALYFNQDGDHFIYDGFEMGEYDKGDVTVLDKLK